MFKQTIIVVIITALAVYFAHQFGVVLSTLGHFQTWTAHQINRLSPQSIWLHTISNIITIIIIPIIVGLVPAFIYWLIEKKEMPKLKELIGVLWLVLLLVFVMHR